jgi:BirA family biotin operon repressor/biotin-[acetyl-CoA-carboxylase] ligase
MLVFGHTIEELDVVDSTNNYLIKKSKRERVFEGEVVFAHFQTSGKGQRESNWESSPGKNLMCSIFALPNFLSGDNFFLLSKAIAIAIKEVVEEICVTDSVEVKWPNDIYVNRKKIGGILIENQFKGNSMKQAVIGLGLNINQTNFENPKAISLKLLTSKQFKVKEILNLILQRFEYYYLNLKWSKFHELEDNYLGSLMNYNQIGEYFIEKKPIQGTIKNVGNNGLLEMEINHKLESFQFKEIRFKI